MFAPELIPLLLQMKLPVGYVGNGMVHQATAFGGLGQKLLEKHGWEKGQGLGRERNGISKAIEVQKKEDQLGVRCAAIRWRRESESLK